MGAALHCPLPSILEKRKDFESKEQKLLDMSEKLLADQALKRIRERESKHTDLFFKMHLAEQQDHANTEGDSDGELELESVI